MRFDWWTLALQAINFLVLVALLRRFLYRPVARTIARRQAETAAGLADAAAATARAEAERQRYEGERAGWPAEHERLVQKAEAQLEAERQQRLQAARAEMEMLASAARRRLDEERAEALGQLRAHTVDLAVELAAQLLQQAASSAVTELLLERLTERLNALPAGELASLRAQVSDGGALDIVTAPPLDAEAEARWRARLSERLGPGAHLRFSSDERLIAGAELHFPTAMLRLSWRDALDGARRELTSDVHPHG